MYLNMCFIIRMQAELDWQTGAVMNHDDAVLAGRVTLRSQGGARPKMGGLRQLGPREA